MNTNWYYWTAITLASVCVVVGGIVGYFYNTDHGIEILALGIAVSYGAIAWDAWG